MRPGWRHCLWGHRCPPPDEDGPPSSVGAISAILSPPAAGAFDLSGAGGVRLVEDLAQVAHLHGQAAAPDTVVEVHHARRAFGG